MELVSPFQVNTFNTINGLGDSHEAYKAGGGSAIVDSSLRDLFCRHHMTNIFGVCLVHRHFPLRSGEVLVDNNGTASPWEVPESTENTSATLSYSKYGGRISPMCWTIGEDGLYFPYEFFFEPNAGATSATTFYDGLSLDDFVAKNTAFFTEFRDLIDKHRMRGILGLRLLKGESGLVDRTVEITERFSNITFPLPANFEDGNTPTGSFLEATWVYNDEVSTAGNEKTQEATKFCLSYCRDPQTGRTHFSIHCTID